ncbi:DNA-processing protein DprA [Putridiphycobacter roseus]|nr:DNA-processing protein DprA [Putridiphycobacter roseus]
MFIIIHQERWKIIIYSLFLSLMQQKIYEIALSLMNGIGPKRAKTLVSYLGSAEEVFKVRHKIDALIPGVSKQLLKAVKWEECLQRAEIELEWMDKNSIDVHFYLDQNYPKKLKQCDDGPVVFYAKGGHYNKRKNIAVVGTRKCTSYGVQMTRDLIHGLKDFNVQIVSGLAFGIDIAAHKAALEFDVPTIGVLAHGLDDLYPVGHKSTAKKMLENGGGLISEFMSNTVAEKENFPKRNRIVAGMCDATIVVESSQKGGSLITAGLANDYNRDVFAFPGNADKTSSVGCNYLIQKNRAHLITCAQDMIDILGWQDELASTPIQTDLFTSYSPEEEKILNILREKGITQIDDLCHFCAMTVSQLSVQLFNLEMKGAIRALSGKRFEFI